jgi:hypothetical protein
MLLGPGREFASRFQKLGGHLLKVLHFVPTAFRCAERNSAMQIPNSGAQLPSQ